ncbi:LacI family DNA-binding transcriptional regulator [Nakamurella flavida]|uniref:LacI family DNA-binding transcriptional regulator n=1 Tax=Nakamurella flavida TaxID=363630 RepID=A0A938YI99_9ACTN|nr:LacI family DNA-binding transcriptional regulator [Nakamurella flavida]MDP9778587.1 LacI family transcriptional regulator [Nakamurella flavida]
MTGYDVARLAGVSQSAVSLALRDSTRISPETKKRILDAVEALGYTPSQVGRSLATRRTGRIGVVTGELLNPFYPALLAPLHDALMASGNCTVLLTTSADGSDEKTDLAPIFDGSLDGVVLTALTVSSPLPGALTRAGIPFVFLNREVDGDDADSCVPDDDGGVQTVVRELVGLGHRRLGMISGPMDVSTARARRASFVRHLADHEIALPDERIVVGSFTHEAGQRGLRQLLGGPHPPTAVFCANDVIALGALDAAAADGIDVPGDVSVVGFDDIAPAGWSVFDLTTVRVNLAAMAAGAAELLVRRIRDKEAAPERRVVATTLARRRTHAAVRG